MAGQNNLKQAMDQISMMQPRLQAPILALLDALPHENLSARARILLKDAVDAVRVVQFVASQADPHRDATRSFSADEDLEIDDGGTVSQCDDGDAFVQTWSYTPKDTVLAHLAHRYGEHGEELKLLAAEVDPDLEDLEPESLVECLIEHASLHRLHSALVTLRRRGNVPADKQEQLMAGVVEAFLFKPDQAEETTLVAAFQQAGKVLDADERLTIERLMAHIKPGPEYRDLVETLHPGVKDLSFHGQVAMLVARYGVGEILESLVLRQVDGDQIAEEPAQASRERPKA